MTSTDTATIAVTGGAGFIGSRVIERLRAAHPEWDVVALDNQYRGQVSSVGDVDIRHVDIRDRRVLEETLDGADVVLHLAALSGVDDCDSNRDLAYEVNVQGTNNVAWFCRRTGAGLVFPFSMATIGNPQSFPITVDHPRDPLNWYARTKVLGEQAIEVLAEDSFPAHLYMKSNLYGEHEVDGTTVSKPTVINFFVDRVFSEEPLTVYEPGTQSRNFVHVKDVARAYVRSTEQLLTQSQHDETGVEAYELASSQDLSVRAVAELVQKFARDIVDIETDIELVPNPRGNETLVEEFEVDISQTRQELDWEPAYSVRESIESLLKKKM